MNALRSFLVTLLISVVVVTVLVSCTIVPNLWAWLVGGACSLAFFVMVWLMLHESMYGQHEHDR